MSFSTPCSSFFLKNRSVRLRVSQIVGLKPLAMRLFRRVKWKIGCSKWRGNLARPEGGYGLPFLPVLSPLFPRKLGRVSPSWRQVSYFLEWVKNALWSTNEVGGVVKTRNLTKPVHTLGRVYFSS